MSSYECNPFLGEESEFRHLTPSDELVCRDIQAAAGHASAELCNTWFKRPTTDWRDPRTEVNAYIATLDFDRVAREEAETIEGLPPLPYFEDGFSVASAVDAVRRVLPFAAEERTAAQEDIGEWVWGLERLDENRAFINGLLDREPELLVRWFAWLREPETAGGYAEPSLEIKTARAACSKLNYALWASLPEED
jgi:hypothetical protein